MDGYVEAYVLDIHLIHPDGTDEKSHLYASSNGFYYLPIIIDDTWVSGTYTAYVQFREFMDDASTFTVINNSIKDDSVDLELIESEIILEIYPNPFRERTTIDFGRVIIDGNLKVIDILGNVVDVYELKNQRELVIEKGTKSKGVYFVEVKINNHKIFKKITLQ